MREISRYFYGLNLTVNEIILPPPWLTIKYFPTSDSSPTLELSESPTPVKDLKPVVSKHVEQREHEHRTVLSIAAQFGCVIETLYYIYLNHGKERCNKGITALLLRSAASFGGLHSR